MAYRIRPATVRDITFMQELTRESNTTRHDTHNGFLEFEELPAEEYARIIQQQHTFVAEENTTPLGFVTGLRLTEMTLGDPLRIHLAMNYPEGIYFEQLAVIPEKYRKGIGSNMLRQGIEHAAQDYGHSYSSVALTPKLNTASLQLFKKAGFKITQKVPIEDLTFAILSRRL